MAAEPQVDPATGLVAYPARPKRTEPDPKAGGGKQAGRAAGRFRLFMAFWKCPATPELSHAAQSVWLFLWGLSDGRRRCFPSVRRIAARLGCSARRVKYALAELRKAGYLRVVCPGTNVGKNRANVYEIGVPGGAAGCPYQGQQVAP